MNTLSSIRQARLFPTPALLQRFTSFNPASFLGCVKSFSVDAQSFENVGNLERNLDGQRQPENASALFTSRFQSYMNPSGPRDFVMGRNVNPMSFVKQVIDEDGKSTLEGPEYSRVNVETDADFVHIKLKRNNTFVTVTDAKGNKKCGASAGHLSELKGGASRYAAEATAEHVGRMARNMGIKSVVVRVKGFTHFKKKRQAIMSFREGFCNTRSDRNPIVYIEDTTRRPHNGCRLPKKRRI